MRCSFHAPGFSEDILHEMALISRKTNISLYNSANHAFYNAAGAVIFAIIDTNLYVLIVTFLLKLMRIYYNI